MKKSSVVVILVLIMVESLLVAGHKLFFQPVSRGLLNSGLSAFNWIVGNLMIVVSLGIAGFLLFPGFRKKITRLSDTPFIQNRFIRGITVVILVCICYEAFQNLLFMTSEAASLHYQGYIKLLTNHFSLMVWFFLVSVQLLGLIAIHHAGNVKASIKTYSFRKWLGIFLLAVVIVLVFHGAGFGYLPDQIQTDRFEELNAPLLGIQVIGVVLVLAALLILSAQLKKVKKLVPDQWGDLILFLVLFSFAFITWNAIPIRESTFIDTPRPPNYES